MGGTTVGPQPSGEIYFNNTVLALSTTTAGGADVNGFVRAIRPGDILRIYNNTTGFFNITIISQGSPLVDTVAFLVSIEDVSTNVPGETYCIQNLGPFVAPCLRYTATNLLNEVQKYGFFQTRPNSTLRLNYYAQNASLLEALKCVKQNDTIRIIHAESPSSATAECVERTVLNFEIPAAALPGDEIVEISIDAEINDLIVGDDYYVEFVPHLTSECKNLFEIECPSSDAYCASRAEFHESTNVNRTDRFTSCSTVARPVGTSLPCTAMQLHNQPVVSTLNFFPTENVTDNVQIYRGPDNPFGCNLILYYNDNNGDQRQKSFVIDQNNTLLNENGSNFTSGGTLFANQTVIDQVVYKGTVYVLYNQRNGTLNGVRNLSGSLNRTLPLALANSNFTFDNVFYTCITVDAKFDRLLVGRNDGAIYSLEPTLAIAPTLLATIPPSGSFDYFIGDMVCIDGVLFCVCSTNDGNDDFYAVADIYASPITFTIQQTTARRSFEEYAIQPGIAAHPLCPVIYVVQTIGSESTYLTLQVTSLHLIAGSNSINVVDSEEFNVDRIFTTRTFNDGTLQRLRPNFHQSVLQMIVPLAQPNGFVSFSRARSASFSPPTEVGFWQADGTAEITVGDNNQDYITELRLNDLTPGRTIEFDISVDIITPGFVPADFTTSSGFYFDFQNSANPMAIPPPPTVQVNNTFSTTQTVPFGTDRLVLLLRAGWADAFNPPPSPFPVVRITLTKILVDGQSVFRALPNNLIELSNVAFPALLSVSVRENNVSRFTDWRAREILPIDGEIYPRSVFLSGERAVVAGLDSLNVYRPNGGEKTLVNNVVPLTFPSHIIYASNGTAFANSALADPIPPGSDTLMIISSLERTSNFNYIDEQIQENNILIFEPKRRALVRVESEITYDTQSAAVGDETQFYLLVDNSKGYYYQRTARDSAPNRFTHSLDAVVLVENGIRIVYDTSRNIILPISQTINGVVFGLSHFHIEFLRYIEENAPSST